MRKRKKNKEKKEEKEIWSFQEQRNSVSIQNVYKILSPETNKRNKTQSLKKQRNMKSQEAKNMYGGTKNMKQNMAVNTSQ